MLFALDTGVDDWRAIPAAGHLQAAAGDLAPRLCQLLATARDRERAASVLGVLTRLGAPSSIPIVTDVLKAAVRSKHWYTARAALETLAAFGPDATGVLDVVRALVEKPPPRPLAAVDDVWPAAVTALAAIGGDVSEVLPPALTLIREGIWYRVIEAADTLAKIGPRAEAALPDLRSLLTSSDVWVRAHAAAAIWDIAGSDQARLVHNTLLTAWQQNDATTSLVVACLDRMGRAAEPALPQLHAWLTRPRRRGRWNENDEDLQRLVQTVISKF